MLGESERDAASFEEARAGAEGDAGHGAQGGLVDRLGLIEQLADGVGEDVVADAFDAACFLVRGEVAVP